MTRTAHGWLARPGSGRPALRTRRLALRQCLAVVLGLAPLIALSADYRFATPPLEIKFSPGGWSGKHAFQDVWCARFPDPKLATDAYEGLMGGGGIYFLRVAYSDRSNAYVVTSTLPEGRTAASDMAMQLQREQANAQAVANAGGRYEVEPVATGFGRGVQLEIANVVESGPDGPFPLARPMVGGSTDRPVSLAVHRIFAQGGNRYEIALFGAPAPADGGRATEKLRERLTRRAVALQGALTECTAAMQDKHKGGA